MKENITKQVDFCRIRNKRAIEPSEVDLVGHFGRRCQEQASRAGFRFVGDGVDPSLALWERG